MSNEPTHTPGPWNTGKPERVGKTLMHRDMHVGNFELKRFVASCEFWDTPGGDEENRANARLVAAAPDLYAALETLVQKLVIDDDEGLVEYAEPMIAAREALAKARGESQP